MVHIKMVVHEIIHVLADNLIAETMRPSVGVCEKCVAAKLIAQEIPHGRIHFRFQTAQELEVRAVVRIICVDVHRHRVGDVVVCRVLGTFALQPFLPFDIDLWKFSLRLDKVSEIPLVDERYPCKAWLSGVSVSSVWVLMLHQLASELFPVAKSAGLYGAQQFELVHGNVAIPVDTYHAPRNSPGDKEIGLNVNAVLYECRDQPVKLIKAFGIESRFIWRPFD